ncbi:hypothetical protein ACP70R_003105 [Stipagrostis hirtigluma subsp. patula]
MNFLVSENVMGDGPSPILPNKALGCNQGNRKSSSGLPPGDSSLTASAAIDRIVICAILATGRWRPNRRRRRDAPPRRRRAPTNSRLSGTASTRASASPSSSGRPPSPSKATTGSGPFLGLCGLCDRTGPPKSRVLKIGSTL